MDFDRVIAACGPMSHLGIDLMSFLKMVSMTCRTRAPTMPPRHSCDHRFYLITRHVKLNPDRRGLPKLSLQPSNTGHLPDRTIVVMTANPAPTACPTTATETEPQMHGQEQGRAGSSGSWSRPASSSPRKLRARAKKRKQRDHPLTNRSCASFLGNQ